ncbi:MAG: TusE/DsrC/DsvC family sulfur relay protein [Gammaproteobacteria bacterium]|jgi:tRNA 2-thiouridine synthesizing protein E|nr:TusE/DsrC/DsvC family sulfur relay protein [Gammaproteobacteria bacterium]
MTIDIEGRSIATNENGFLENPEDWTPAVAEAMAAEEQLTLTDRHWDLINYLREEYFSNNGNQPNNRTLLKEMGSRWGEKVSNKELFDLFPGNPSKQAGRLAGLPESMRKGGY